MAMDSNDRDYTNGEITVFWQPSKCIHATTCYRELIEVFNPRNRPWVNMDGAPTDRIIEIINKCPTDALTYRWNDSEKNKLLENLNDEKISQALSYEKSQTDTPVMVQVMKDGPYVVQGNFTIIGSTGNKLKSMSMTSFCRCGVSNNMPFCDGTHRKAGFTSEK